MPKIETRRDSFVQRDTSHDCDLWRVPVTRKKNRYHDRLETFGFLPTLDLTWSPRPRWS